MCFHGICPYYPENESVNIGSEQSQIQKNFWDYFEKDGLHCMPYCHCLLPALTFRFLPPPVVAVAMHLGSHKPGQNPGVVQAR
jgi:hypothetical protein